MKNGEQLLKLLKKHNKGKDRTVTKLSPEEARKIFNQLNACSKAHRHKDKKNDKR